MAFPRNLLNEREELVLDLRPHWFFLAKQALALFVAVVFGIAVLAALDSGSAKSVLSIVAGIAVVGTLAWFVWTYLVWNTTMFVLTSDRIVTRRGVLSKQGVEIPLERVNTVFFKQSVFERMLGSGDLAIESAGERGTESFSNIRKPSIVQKEIYVQMEHNENRKFDRINPAPAAAAAATDPTAVQGGAQSIPEQIEKLAELHQRGVLSDAEYQRKKAELLDRM
ncbi:PH domain-containing protein [Aquihabitans sp. G128]|uniref:PH domain-containing protein n=1 Tax=Aquihabitans sp. G128 TaxID=2849779 RepID=UPI001C217C1A|nr:PH domain-containing protein [Aquihabitans sp. G128]QXC62521.1 PH domain-containing protein [Aquihabitans sp. G128]